MAISNLVSLSNITLLQNAIAAIKPITYNSITTATGAPPIANETTLIAKSAAKQNPHENVPPTVPPVDSKNFS
ncbi:unnamed protein product [Rodentolepis nana]|uniref:Reverse transcriptase domain-containing protein n=1 Tax=Rodentolepis nana TaxID=102285 RepID=A0A0R3TQZ7_RODNA|nr:unnamed protein product [Rodentolepis nana]